MVEVTPLPPVSIPNSEERTLSSKSVGQEYNILVSLPSYPNYAESNERYPVLYVLDPNKPDKNKFYDQIAWFTGNDNTPALSLKFARGGNFDFTKIALKSLNLTKQQLSYRISDHYPLWAEFEVRE